MRDVPEYPHRASLSTCVRTGRGPPAVTHSAGVRRGDAGAIVAKYQRLQDADQDNVVRIPGNQWILLARLLHFSFKSISQCSSYPYLRLFDHN